MSVESKVKSGILLLALFPILAMIAAWQQQNFPGGSGSGASSVFPGNTINVTSAPYNMTGGYQIYDAAITSTSPNVTSTAFTFTSAMIGWLAHYTNCSASPCIGSVYEFPLNSSAENTIIGCSPSCPSHVAIMSTNASASVAAGSGIFTFGPNNDAGWTALEAALNAYSTTPNCPVVLFGGGYYMTRKGRFNTTTCLNPAWNNSFTSGQDHLLTLSGLGEPTNSYIEVTQDFDYTTGSTNSCGGGVSNNTCFGGAQATKWMNIGIDGGGASLTTLTHSVNVIESTNDSYAFQFYCTNWGASDGAMIGLKGSSGSQPSAFLQFVGCGKTPLSVATGATIISSSFFGGTTGTILTVASGATFQSSLNGIGYLSACPANVTQWSISGLMYSTKDNTGSCGAVNNTGISIATGGGLIATELGDAVGGTASSSGVTINGTGILTCGGCLISSAGSGVNANPASGGGFRSLGGNTLIGTANGGLVTSSGSPYGILMPTDNPTTNGNPPVCTFTSGGGTVPSCAIQAGSTPERGVIIATTGTGSPGSTGTITVNFIQVYTLGGATPVCIFNIDNSGTAWGNGAGVQINAENSTVPVVAWSNSVANVLTALTASSPYRIGYLCMAR